MVCKFKKICEHYYPNPTCDIMNGGPFSGSVAYCGKYNSLTDEKLRKGAILLEVCC